MVNFGCSKFNLHVPYTGKYSACDDSVIPYYSVGFLLSKLALRSISNDVNHDRSAPRGVCVSFDVVVVSKTQKFCGLTF